MTVSSFTSFGFHPRLQSGIEAAGYTKPTPIQEKSLPAGLAGRDLLGLAQTGTGKTACFVLPILHRLLAGRRGVLRALVVAPTRELADQINEEIRTLGRHCGLRSATVYGGVGKAPQVRALRGKTDIIVACPGRLLDHIRQGDADLSAVEFLVLDEADHMFDMGFLPDVRAIVERVPRSAQRMLFSATMPADLRRLASAVLTDAVTVEIGRTAPADTVGHSLYPVGKENKLRLLRHLLDEADLGSALIFTKTKHGAKRLAERLDGDGLRVASLQGNLSQTRRQKALDGFRDGRYDVLVATDIAARGIDVSRVSHVINFDVPATAEGYTHRIGRTGRAERNGDAYTLVTPDDESTIGSIERSLGMDIPRVILEGFAPTGGAAAHPPTDRPERDGPTRQGSSGRHRRSGSNRPGGRSARGSRHRFSQRRD